MKLIESRSLELETILTPLLKVWRPARQVSGHIMAWFLEFIGQGLRIIVFEASQMGDRLLGPRVLRMRPLRSQNMLRPGRQKDDCAISNPMLASAVRHSRSKIQRHVF